MYTLLVALPHKESSVVGFISKDNYPHDGVLTIENRIYKVAMTNDETKEMFVYLVANVPAAKTPEEFGVVEAVIYGGEHNGKVLKVKKETVKPYSNIVIDGDLYIVTSIEVVPPDRINLNVKRAECVKTL